MFYPGYTGWLCCAPSTCVVARTCVCEGVSAPTFVNIHQLRLEYSKVSGQMLS